MVIKIISGNGANYALQFRQAPNYLDATHPERTDMTIKIEVDVTSTPPGQLIKLAKYMLECAGYTEQAAAPGPAERTAPLVTRDTPLGAYHNDETVTSITTDEKEAVGNAFAGLPDLSLTATQAPGIEVDSAGMPWDHRIHASSRAKVADGTWRQRRNLDPNVLAQVQAEMLQVMGLPAPTPTPVTQVGAQSPETIAHIPDAPATPEQAFIDAVIPPPPPAAHAVAVPVPPPFAPSAVVPAAPVAIAPPPPSTPAGVATIASPSNPVTFPQLVTRITKMLAAKELTQGDIAGACQSLGIPHMPALASRPDLIPSMATALGIAL
jgi:hypothetical protein